MTDGQGKGPGMEEETIDGDRANDTVVERFTLSNGLRVVTEEIPWVQSVSIGFFLLVGSAYETRRLSGMSHFIEHMVFKGSVRRTPRDIAMDIESLGGVINAGTSKEFTNFYCRIYHKHLPEAVDVLTDLMLKPKFNKVDIEREKLVVLEEIKMGEDNPDEFIVDRFYRKVLGDSVFGRKIVGNLRNVLSFTRADIVDFHRKYYLPSRMVVSASGKLKGKEFCDLLEENFRKARAWKNAKPRKIGVRVKPKFNHVRFLERKDVEQTTLIIGFPSVSVYDPERYPFAVVDSYLAGGMSSRLFQEVREKRGLVYSIDSTQAPMSRFGLYTIDAGMSAKNAPKVARLIGKELGKIVSKGLSKKGFKNAREYIKGVMLLGLENPIARMSRNAMSELFHHRYMPIEELIETLDKVTREDVQGVAKQVFDPARSAIGIMTSENGKEEADSLLQNVTDEFLAG